MCRAFPATFFCKAGRRLMPLIILSLQPVPATESSTRDSVTGASTLSHWLHVTVLRSPVRCCASTINFSLLFNSSQRHVRGSPIPGRDSCPQSPGIFFHASPTAHRPCCSFLLGFLQSIVFLLHSSAPPWASFLCLHAVSAAKHAICGTIHPVCPQQSMLASKFFAILVLLCIQDHSRQP